jgi:hypothetical protein
MAMSDEDWNEIKQKIEEWKESHADWETAHADDLFGLEKYLGRGDKNPTRRNSIKNLFREMFYDLPENPFVTSKVGAGLTAEMVKNRDALLDAASTLLATFFNENPEIQALMTKNGKSGGGFYLNGNEYAQSALYPASKNLLNRMYKKTDKYNREWLGEYDPTAEDASTWLPSQVNPLIETTKAKPKSKK